MTGASGFLGTHLIRHLLTEHHSVTAFVRSSSRTEALVQLQSWGEKLRIINVETDPLSDAFSSFDVGAVVHVATSYGRGETPIEAVLMSNLIYPISVIEAAIHAGVPLFINTDSFFNKPNFTYGHLMHYATSKRALLDWLRQLSSEIRIVNLRLEHVYGPGDHIDKFVPSVFQAIAKQRNPVFPMTHGHQRRDFIHVDDVVRAYSAVLSAEITMTESKKALYSEFEVGTGKSTEIRQIPLIVKELSNSRTNILFGEFSYRNDEIMDSRSSSFFGDTFGWEAKIDLRNGLFNMMKTPGEF
jgi:CDP-paratose synthetase